MADVLLMVVVRCARCHITLNGLFGRVQGELVRDSEEYAAQCSCLSSAPLCESQAPHCETFKLALIS